MSTIKVIMPLESGKHIPKRLEATLKNALINVKHETFTDINAMPEVFCGKILFVISIDESGLNHAVYRLIALMRTGVKVFRNCVGAVVTDGSGELYTKAISRELVFAANYSGCAFLGRPLVEATGTLRNFHIQAALNNTKLQEAYQKSTVDLVTRLMEHRPFESPPRKILVLHTSNLNTSNTFALWEMIKSRLDDVEIKEINLRNGTVSDCAGCSYTTCLHFGEKGGCFYGGVVVDDVFPAVKQCDAMMLLCPNYNDAVSAGLTAFINRLTALFRQQRFYDKRLYGVIVSGYSGSEIVAQQLISSLCMNKSFFLPPRFCILETANDAKSILSLKGIRDRAVQYANWIKKEG
jgi:multimeric flavodoxin WrbA